MGAAEAWGSAREEALGTEDVTIHGLTSTAKRMNLGMLAKLGSSEDEAVLEEACSREPAKQTINLTSVLTRQVYQAPMTGQECSGPVGAEEFKESDCTKNTKRANGVIPSGGECSGTSHIEESCECKQTTVNETNETANSAHKSKLASTGKAISVDLDAETEAMRAELRD